MLQYLADCSHTDGDFFASAQQFRLYQLLLDSIYTNTGDDKDLVNEAALDEIWQMKSLCDQGSGEELSTGQIPSP